MRLDDVLAILAAFEAEEVRYAVFGALALAAHGIDRATRDLDVFVAPDEENVSRLRRALAAIFDDPSIEEITAQDLGGEYPAVQYGPPNVDFTIDIVSRLGETFTFDDLDVEEVAAGNATIKVVSPAMLYRMKRDTVRLRDQADAERLRQVFGFEE